MCLGRARLRLLIEITLVQQTPHEPLAREGPSSRSSGSPADARLVSCRCASIPQPLVFSPPVLPPLSWTSRPPLLHSLSDSYVSSVLRPRLHLDPPDSSAPVPSTRLKSARDFIYGKPPAEQLQEWQRKVKREQRTLDKEIREVRPLGRSSW